MNMEKIYNGKVAGEQSFFAPTGMANINKPIIKSDKNVYDYASLGNIHQNHQAEYTRNDAPIAF